MIVAMDDDFMRMSISKGNTDLLIVSCASAGELPFEPGGPGGQREEFKGSLRNRRDHIIYIIDKMRSWYSEPKIMGPITEAIRNYCREHSIKRIATLGVSMGGAGAVILGELLDADRAVSFSPQSSVARSLGFEDRYDEYLVNFPEEYPFKDCCAVPSMRERTILITSDYQDNDILHAERFFRHGFSPVILRNCDHNSPKKIKSCGLLQEVMSLAIDGTREDVVGLLKTKMDAVHEQSELFRVVRAHFLYLESLKDDVKHDAALALAKKAVETDPETAKFHRRLGDLLAEDGDFKGAEAHCGRAVEIDPTEPSFHLSLSHVAAKNNRSDKAFKHARTALRLAPRNARCFDHFAWLLFESGDLSGAEGFQRKALELDPDDARFHSGYGRILQKLGRPGAAVREVRRAVELDGDNPDLHNFLGALLLELNDIRGAEEEVLTALSLDSENGVYHALHSRILHRSGRLAESIAAVDRAVSHEKDNPHYYHHLGNLLMIGGDMHNAVTAHRIAVGLAPEEPVFRRRLLEAAHMAESVKAQQHSAAAPHESRPSEQQAGAPGMHH